MRPILWLSPTLLLLALFVSSFSLSERPATPTAAGPPRGPRALSPGDWPFYAGDLEGRRFSQLEQINPGNVKSLSPAWSFAFEPRLEGSQATPLAIGGRLFLPCGDGVVCLNGTTGEVVWRTPFLNRRLSHRGLGYWPGNSQHSPRILVTMDRSLVALDATDGAIVKGFGVDGAVELAVPYRGSPTVFKNLVLVGSNTSDQIRGVSGNPAAYDVVSGEKLWDFQTVLQGEAGTQSWGEGWKNRGGSNVWAFSLTVDPLNEIVYLPIAAPADDFWGGDRPGQNLYSNCVVALEARTGRYLWHFQTVHHDLWNYDLAAAPTLLELRGKDGKLVQGLALGCKTGYLFLLDRLTGEPIFDVVEKPVPAGNVPDEWYSPTQPVPVKPRSLCRTSFSSSDLATAEQTSPQHAAAARELWERFGGLSNSGPFTPFQTRAGGASTVQMPGAQGGICWGGLALDPARSRVFCNSKNLGQIGFMEANPNYQPGSSPKFVRNGVDGGGAMVNTMVAFRGASGDMARLPASRPPWANLVAVDCQTGEIAWETPLGLAESLPPGKQRTGLAMNAGPLATASGLVFIGATFDQRLRAFDSATGQELWDWRLEAPVEANPMTYLGTGGEQYVAAVARDRLVAFSLR